MKVGWTACAFAIAVFGLAAASALAATFADPTGDTIVVPEGADTTGLSIPDITAIEVTNTPDGVVTFRITVTAQTLTPVSLVAILLDLDKNRGTGLEGDEAVLGMGVFPPGVTQLLFERLDELEGEMVEVTSTNATASFTGGVATITVPRSELFDTRGFTFLVAAITAEPNGSAGVVDFAPDPFDFEDPFVYDLEGLPPPPPPTLTALGLAGTPLPPKAGKRFVVSTVVTRSDTETIVTSGKVACTARIGKAKMRATGRFASLRAHCSMTVPRSAKGKLLRGTMTVSTAGASLRKAFTFRVA
ncbi:MAG: hypothetical protein HW413_166 [Thermoleophilia bacterium]|nr:hypothetical protein [Thermoleophilia bacterium]